MRKFLFLIPLTLFFAIVGAVCYYAPTEPMTKEEALTDTLVQNNEGYTLEESGCGLQSYFDFVTDSVKEKIKAYEGLKLHTYIDGHGRMAIGYGHVQKNRRRQYITQEQADRYFEQDLAVITHYLNELQIAHTQNEFDALVCFVYNVGTTQFYESDLKAVIEGWGSPGEVRHEFLRWVHTNGKPCKGLITRRQWESDLFLAYSI